jgi:hypothetical protein
MSLVQLTERRPWTWCGSGADGPALGVTDEAVLGGHGRVTEGAIGEPLRPLHGCEAKVVLLKGNVSNDEEQDKDKAASTGAL